MGRTILQLAVCAVGVQGEGTLAQFKCQVSYSDSEYSAAPWAVGVAHVENLCCRLPARLNPSQRASELNSSIPFCYCQQPPCIPSKIPSPQLHVPWRSFTGACFRMKYGGRTHLSRGEGWGSDNSVTGPANIHCGRARTVERRFTLEVCGTETVTMRHITYQD